MGNLPYNDSAEKDMVTQLTAAIQRVQRVRGLPVTGDNVARLHVEKLVADLQLEALR